MPRVLTLLAWIAFATTATFEVGADCLPHSWSVSHGGPSQDVAWSVAVAPDGATWVTGSYAETVDFGDGPLTSSGRLDIFVLKLGPDGSDLWSGTFGGPSNDEIGYGVVSSPDGGAFVTGSIGDDVDFGGGVLPRRGANDLFLLRLAPDGSHVWSRRIGSDWGDEGRAVAATADGGVLVTGVRSVLNITVDISVFTAKFSGDGDLLWSQDYGHDFFSRNGHSVAETPDGGAVITGFHEYLPGFQTDAILVRYGPDGRFLWGRWFGDVRDDLGSSVSVGADGSIYLAGHFEGTMNFVPGQISSPGQHSNFLVKLSPAGGHLWSRVLGTSQQGRHASGSRIAATPNGGVAVTGHFLGTADFGGGPLVSAGLQDAFLAVFDADGTHRCSRRFGSPSADVAYGLAVRPNGSLRIAGYSNASMDVGGGALPHRGGADIFVFELADYVTSTRALTWLGSEVDSDGVRLTWYAPGPDPIAAAIVRRQSDTGWTTVAHLQGTGRLEFTDRGLRSGRYGYALRIRDGQRSSLTEAIWVDVPAHHALDLAMKQGSPGAKSAIEFTLPGFSQGSIELFDLSGRVLRSRDITQLGPGVHRWSLEEGDAIPSGVYFARLRHGDGALSRRCVLVQ